MVAATTVLAFVACGERVLATESMRGPSPTRYQDTLAVHTLLGPPEIGLLACTCIVTLCVLGQNGIGNPHGRCGTPATGWPRRRHYLLLALFFSGIAVYGSLVPFRCTPLGFGEAVQRFKGILSGPISPGSRGNFVANVLLFVPIGYCLLAALTLDRRGWVLTVLCAMLVSLLCAALSLAVEFGQLWLPTRVTSSSDIVAQIIGATAGMVLWVMVGPAVTDWVRSFTFSARPKDQIDWLLRAYLIGLLIYCVMPLDLITRPAELIHKYREGKIVLMPFAAARLDFATLYGLIRDALVFIPVGMLAATWQISPPRNVRPLPASVLLGGLVVAAVETAQLLVYSRVTATGDLLAGTLGVGVGAVMMRLWRGEQGACPSPPRGKGARRAWLWLGLAVVYALLLAAIFCAPLKPVDDLDQIKARYHGFLGVPFGSFYTSSELELISDVLKKGLLFAPLGAMLTLAVASLPVPRPIRCILICIGLLAAAAWATSIEMAQVFLPPHVPSSGDVILCAVGAAVGMFLTLRIAAARRRSD